MTSRSERFAVTLKVYCVIFRMIYRLKCNIIYITTFQRSIKTLHNELLCFYYRRMSNLYLHTPRVPLHGRHHVSTASLNGQTTLQSAFRHYVVLV